MSKPLTREEQFKLGPPPSVENGWRKADYFCRHCLVAKLGEQKVLMHPVNPFIWACPTTGDPIYSPCFYTVPADRAAA